MMNKFVKTLIYRPCYKPRVDILIVKCTGIPCTINLTRKLMNRCVIDIQRIQVSKFKPFMLLIFCNNIGYNELPNAELAIGMLVIL